MATNQDVPKSIDAGARSIHDLDHLDRRSGRARHASPAKADVLDTKPLDSLLRWLKRKEAR